MRHFQSSKAFSNDHNHNVYHLSLTACSNQGTRWWRGAVRKLSSSAPGLSALWLRSMPRPGEMRSRCMSCEVVCRNFFLDLVTRSVISASLRLVALSSPWNQTFSSMAILNVNPFASITTAISYSSSLQISETQAPPPSTSPNPSTSPFPNAVSTPFATPATQT